MYIISCLFQVLSHGINYAYDLNCLLEWPIYSMGRARFQSLAQLLDKVLRFGPTY